MAGVLPDAHEPDEALRRVRSLPRDADLGSGKEVERCCLLEAISGAHPGSAPPILYPMIPSPSSHCARTQEFSNEKDRKVKSNMKNKGTGGGGGVACVSP